METVASFHFAKAFRQDLRLGDFETAANLACSKKSISSLSIGLRSQVALGGSREGMTPTHELAAVTLLKEHPPVVARVFGWP